MIDAFSVSHANAILNFTKDYCAGKSELLNSMSFKRVLQMHIAYLKRKDKPLYHTLIAIRNNDEELAEDLLNILKMLLVLDTKSLSSAHPDLQKYLLNKPALIDFVETLFAYWRSLQRYAVIYSTQEGQDIQNAYFVQSHNDFKEMILSSYKIVMEKLTKRSQSVYRQVIAGVNAGLVLNSTPLDFATDTYAIFREIPVIQSIYLTPPFITYSRRNTRDGIFQEVMENPLTNQRLDAQKFICYPAKVGKYLALVYFHTDFMAMGITLANLFEMASPAEVHSRKPDLIYAYGVEDGKQGTAFYHDKERNMMVGYASYSEEIDYFGYMKKMLLTLHNVKGINGQGLPLHGAMAVITMNNDVTKHVVIIGDSGAGKSETLEALRGLEDNGIKEIKIIFDDMGIIYDEGGQVRAYGTEIGAFVRLDDLDPSYAYSEIDRAIFMNPDRINARVVIPVATYEEIVRGYPIDLFLYANNYSDDPNNAMDIMTNLEEAKQVFIDGARMAKGTTQEVGLVKSYFANPFGPVQRKEQTDKLLDQFFTLLAKNRTEIGQLKTRLGIKGNETSGPKDAAIALLAYLNK
ncbi:phosphoenolpyruvate carboxykinase [Spirochaetales bacterium BR151]|uniref:Phosphoenolpyruvate carboxykinase n=2 Tax=Entomospira culicis TaxID=2719989 RepID=A0A968GG16_9SPIO|nr:phosphoenolpyruvate carboxykinase [Entomospira culicis]NIZ69896.1 phosphoenolpyruvate carboxykinase [Entomospira culicis]